MSDINIISLPREIKCRITGWLSPLDAIRLSQTATLMRHHVQLSKLDPPLQLFKLKSWDGSYTDGDKKFKGFCLPILSRRVHTIVLRLAWKDQGWGNQKGQIWIVGQHEHTPRMTDEDFDGGRVVYESDTAPHTEENLTISVCPIEGELYHLWYKVGGGGGHSLLISNVELDSIVFDDSGRHFSRNYRLLHNAGALSNRPMEFDLSFYQSMFLQLTRSLQKHTVDETPIDESITLFLSSHNILLSRASLSTLEEILMSSLERQSQMPSREDFEGSADAYLFQIMRNVGNLPM